MRVLSSRLGLLGILALVGLPAPAGAQHVGSEFQVNTHTQSSQSESSAAAASNGNFVVVWAGNAQDGSASGIFGQRFDSQGTPLGVEFRVNTYTTNSQSEANVASDASGNFVVVWTSSFQDGSQGGVFGQRFDKKGVAQGAEFQINTYTSGLQDRHSVASDESGNFVVVWTSQDYQDGTGVGVFGQRYDSGGVPLGQEFRVNTYTTSGQGDPSVVATPDGRFVVVWDSYTQDGEFSGVFGQRFDSEGVPQGSEFQVNTFTDNSQDSPSVASDVAGNFVVVWQSVQQDGSSDGVFGQRFDSDGARLGQEFRVNTYTKGRQEHPSVASTPAGEFVVTWQSGDQDGSDYGIFAQRYDSGGAPLGVEFRVNTYTTNDQQLASVASMGSSGQFVVTWDSNTQDGNGNGIFGQRVDLAGDSLPPNVTVVTPNGGERLFTSSPYRIKWTATDETGLSSFDVLVSVDGGGSFTPIPECQDVPAPATSCVWLAPGPPSANALVKVTAEDTGGNTASDGSDAPFAIIAGSGAVTVESPNTHVRWPISSPQEIEWSHNLGPESAFRIELDRDDDGSYDEVIAAAAPADGPRSGRFTWVVTWPPSKAARIRVSWTQDLSVTDQGDGPFLIRTVPGSEFQVNTYTKGDQDTSFTAGRVVASDPNGNFVVVWNSDGQDGSSVGIFGQRYNADGHPSGSEFRVNSYTPGSQSRPSVAADASGKFVVVWQSADGSSTGIFARRFNPNGSPIGADFRVNSTTGGDQSNSAVMAQLDGAFVVVWDSGNYEDVFGQRYDSDGHPLGGEFRVNTDTYGFQYNPAVAPGAGGEFVVAWASWSGGYFDPTFVDGQRYASDGTRLGGDFRVTSRGGPPSLASDAAGNFVVVWHTRAEFGGDEVYGRRYDSGGVPLGPEFHVNTAEHGYQEHPAVASDASGDFLVVWSSAGAGDNNGGIFGQRYDAAGQPQGGEFQVNTYTTDFQYSPSLAATGTNEFVVVWTSDGQDGAGEGVFGKRQVFGADASDGTFQVPGTTQDPRESD